MGLLYEIAKKLRDSNKDNKAFSSIVTDLEGRIESNQDLIQTNINCPSNNAEILSRKAGIKI